MKKILLFIALLSVLTCFFVMSANAEVAIYDDAPAKTSIQTLEEDVVTFSDGYSCLSAYIFKDISKIENNYGLSYALDFDYILGKTGKTYTVADIVSIDIPEGITHVGKYAFQKNTTAKKVTIPKTVTSFGSAAFENATGLEYCVFEHTEDSGLTNFQEYMFVGCKNLKAFSMPDCITKIASTYHFSGCTNLSAVYLSKNLITWESGGGGTRSATFDDCTNVYFVNEPFVCMAEDQIPEKPTVYYFPANLESMSNQSIFRGCASLNDVLVFGEKITSAPNEYLFQGGPKNTVVFLGDMTTVSVMYWGSTENVIFANPNDKDASSVTFTKYTGNWNHTCYYNFCSTGNRYTANKGSVDEIVASLQTGTAIHLKEKSLSTEATCVNPKMTADYCFCGAVMGTPETEGEALGHDCSVENGAVDLGIVYNDYFKAGVHKTECARCDAVCEEEVEALFVDRGYSACEFGTSLSIIRGYKVDKKAISDYMAYSTDLKVGVVIAVNQGTEEFVPDFESEKVLSSTINATANDYIDIKIIGIPADKKEALIVLSVYVKEGDKTYFLENGTTTETVIGVDFENAPKS